MATWPASGVRLIRRGFIIYLAFVAVSTLHGVVILAAIVTGGQAQESTADGVEIFFAMIGMTFHLEPLDNG